MIGFALFAANLIAISMLLRFGTREEQAVALAGVACICLPPLIHELQIGTFRYGVFGLELGLLATLLVATARVARWWPILASGAQLLACLSHIIPHLMADIYVWSTVTVRLGIWAFVSLFMLFGAWETWAHRAVHQKGRDKWRNIGSLKQPQSS